MASLDQPAVRARRPARFVVFGLIVVLVVGTLSARLFALQINGRSSQPAVAPVATRMLSSEPIPSTRGLISDRSGTPLVRNVPTFTVRVRPADLPLTKRQSVVERLAGLLHMTPAEVNAAIDTGSTSRFDFVPVARDVQEATARLISEESLTLPGTDVIVETRREYPLGSLFTQIVGYTGPIDADAYAELKDEGYLADDRLGRTGVEAVYEAELRGTYGTRQVERDATGRVLRSLPVNSPAVAGSSLVLTIDDREQRLAQKALQWGLQTARLKKGVIIVMNPQTGEILAMVGLPTYDANLFSRGISSKAYKKLLKDPAKPLLNHAIGEVAPPGSTYKLITGTGVLADRKITPSTRVLTKPYVSVGPTRFWDWNRRGFGRITIFDGFGHSSDTFFYQMAARLGIERLAYWGKQYGFGARTGIDLPGEAAGLVPTNRWKQATFGQDIFLGETLQAGIGQGYDLATPLQLLNAYAALANGGKLYQPQVVREIVGPDGTVARPFEKKLIRKIKAPAWVFTTMRQAARRVVTIRHTYNLVDLPIVVAGKTGTAEFGLRDRNGVLPYHHWFVGFVPKNAWKKNNPTGDVRKADSQLAFVVFAYDSRTAGNTATEIAKYYLQLHFGIKKDYRLPYLLKRANFYQGRT
jgi:penicillin-binding protein 2